MSAPDVPFPSAPENLENRVRSDAAELAAAARHDLKDVGDELKHEASVIAEEAREQVEQATETAKGMAEEQKQALVEQLDGVSSSLDKVAKELEGTGKSSARYIRIVADGASKLTSTVRDNSVDDIIDIAGDFGRKQPVAFMGAAALLGFVASRFIVASASRRSLSSAPALQPSYAPSDSSGSNSISTQSPSVSSYSQVGGDDAGI